MNATKDPRYKTSLCKNFKDGECRYGDRCSFAHGPGELKGRPSLWKTKVADPQGNGSYEIVIKKYIRASSKKEAVQKLLNLDDPLFITVLISDCKWGNLENPERVAKQGKLKAAIFEGKEDLSIKEGREKVNEHKEEIIDFITEYNENITEHDLID